MKLLIGNLNLSNKLFKMKDKVPLVLISCGSFNPITYAHLRMFG
jgi:hypothetical protein